MSKYSHKKSQISQEKSKQSSKQNGEDIKSLTSVSPEISKVEVLKLLHHDPEKMKVKKFFDVMGSQNLSLLKKNPESEVSETLLEEVWSELQDHYYSRTDPKGWSAFKIDLAKLQKINNDITTINASVILIHYNKDSGYEYLKQMGINATNEQDATSALNRKKTSLKIIQSKRKQAGEKEEFNFYKMVANIQKTYGQPIDIKKTTLASWIGYIQVVEDIVKSQEESLSKSKRK